MKPEYIMMICAGGVFALLLLIYFVYAIEKGKAKKRNREKLYKSYLPENLSKLEYDVAFYDKNVFYLNYNSAAERQVTIDDILGDGSEDLSRVTEDAVFAQVEEKGVELITGKFNHSK